MKHPIAHLFLFATMVLMSACPAPSVGPTPSAPSAPPSASSAASEESAKSPTVEEIAEAAPPWTPSSAGSVECGAGSLFAKISLEDRTPVTASLLEFAVTAKDLADGDYGPIETHLFQIDRIRIIDPSPPPKKGFKPEAPIELNAWIDLKSTAEVPRTIVGGDSNPSADFCEMIAAVVAQKRFQVHITHRSGDRLYEKTKGDLPVILAGVSGGPIEDYVFILELRD